MSFQNVAKVSIFVFGLAFWAICFSNCAKNDGVFAETYACFEETTAFVLESTSPKSVLPELDTLLRKFPATLIGGAHRLALEVERQYPDFAGTEACILGQDVSPPEDMDALMVLMFSNEKNASNFLKKSKISTDFQGFTIYEGPPVKGSTHPLLVTQYDAFLIFSFKKWRIEGAIQRLQGGDSEHLSDFIALSNQVSLRTKGATFTAIFRQQAFFAEKNELLSEMETWFSQVHPIAAWSKTPQGAHYFSTNAATDGLEKQESLKVQELIPSDCAGWSSISPEMLPDFADVFGSAAWKTWLQGQNTVLFLRNKEWPPMYIVEFASDNAAMHLFGEKLKNYNPVEGVAGYVIFRLGNAHVAQIGERLVICTQLSPLQRMLESIVSGRTLATDPDFQEFVAENKQNARAGFFVQVQEPFLPPYPQGRGWQSWTFDAEARAGNLNHRTKVADATAKNTQLVWKLPLKATCGGEIRAVKKRDKNHTPSLFMVQDVAGRLYCFDAEGTIHWERQLPEILKSEVWQVDYLPGGKPFYLFNTLTNLWLLNESGTDVGGFPIRQTVSLSAGLTLTDFGSSADYTIFVPNEAGQLLSFDKMGRPRRDWSPDTLLTEVSWPLVHLRTEEKDYLIALNDQGLMAIFDRFGRFIHPVLALEGRPVSAPGVLWDKNGKPTFVVATQGGGIQTWCTAEQVLCKKSAKSPIFALFACPTLVGGLSSADALYLSEQSIMVEKADAQGCPQKLLQVLPLPIEADVFFTQKMSEEMTVLGVLDTKKKWIFAMDNMGDPLFQTRLAGETPFVLTVKEDGNWDKVLTTLDKEVWAYQL